MKTARGNINASTNATVGRTAGRGTGDGTNIEIANVEPIADDASVAGPPGKLHVEENLDETQFHEEASEAGPQCAKKFQVEENVDGKTSGE